MLKIEYDTFSPGNGVVEVNHFPDKTQRLNIYVPTDATNAIITWKYSSDEEMVTLFFIVNHLREKSKNIRLVLNLGYTPNARMDRVKTNDEVFTLKHFCKFINSLEFDYVYVRDPHSNVTPALLNNVVVINPNSAISSLYGSLCGEDGRKNDLCVFYPDAGAMKRYSDVSVSGEVFYGEKVRVWETGEIKGLDIHNKMYSSPVDTLEGKDFLLVDDIISCGGTMYHSVKKLKELGAGKIYLYCTHLEDSAFDPEKGMIAKLFNEGLVETLYTQDTLFSGQNDKIKFVI